MTPARIASRRARLGRWLLWDEAAATVLGECRRDGAVWVGLVPPRAEPHLGASEGLQAMMRRVEASLRDRARPV